MCMPTKYCADCVHVTFPSNEQMAEAVKLLTRSERDRYVPIHKCSHPDNLDKITKQMIPCSEVRSSTGECGKTASKYELRT
jgi:hypothetical protein